MAALVLKEALVEEELHYQVRNALDKHGSKLNNMKFGKVYLQHSIRKGIYESREVRDTIRRKIKELLAEFEMKNK